MCNAFTLCVFCVGFFPFFFRSVTVWVGIVSQDLCVCVRLATAPLSPSGPQPFSSFVAALCFFSFFPLLLSLHWGNTMSGLISFSNHQGLQGKDFWLGCFVPANTKERREKIITLLVDNSHGDDSILICLWYTLYLRLMLSFYTERRYFYKLPDILHLLHVRLRCIQHHLFLQRKTKEEWCLVWRGGWTKGPVDMYFFFLRNSRLGCCNVFLKRCRFWGNRLYKSLGGKSLESYNSGTYVVFIVSLLSFLHILYFFPEKEREIEGVRPRRKREGGEEKKSLLTHKLVNAVALSTFSSNENFYHLHINLISCVSLSPPPPLPH